VIRHDVAAIVWLGLMSMIPSPATAQDTPVAGELRLEPCEPEGVAPPARCGTFTVWEDRDAGEGRTIDLKVVVLDATGSDRPPDPVVPLSGGPGSAATSAARGFSDADLRRQRDIVLVDQRGTGASNGLHCGPEPTAPLQAFMPTLDVERVQACRVALAPNADLKRYLTTIAMDDLDELRAALGYEQWNLVGTSYGTRAALVYIRRHGERVRSATLRGSTALTHPMPERFATDAEAALRTILGDCAADAACANAFPALEDDYRRAVRTIEQAGAMSVGVRDPRGGDSVEVSLRAADFAEALRAMLYAPEASRRIPLLLNRAAASGDYTGFAEFQLRRNLGLARGVALGMYFAVTCTEDVARVDAEAVYASGRGTFLADHRARPHIEGCAGWPLGELPAGFGEEVESDVPVLIITGANDPVTPPASARAAASRLTNARVIIVPDGAHGLNGLDGVDCVDRLAEHFLETADPASPDDDCLADVKRRPFVLGGEGFVIANGQRVH
jgi:pimeloyl-ACP methyl ester carboxylesterase